MHIHERMKRDVKGENFIWFIQKTHKLVIASSFDKPSSTFLMGTSQAALWQRQSKEQPIHANEMQFIRCAYYFAKRKTNHLLNLNGTTDCSIFIMNHETWMHRLIYPSVYQTPTHSHCVHWEINNTNMSSTVSNHQPCMLDTIWLLFGRNLEISNEKWYASSFVKPYMVWNISYIYIYIEHEPFYADQVWVSTT